MNFAIVGCGHIAHKHAEAILNAAGANLVAVCDTDESKMTDFIDKYKAVPYINLDDLLLNNDIDVVNICTPSGFHANLTIKIAEAKKHIIVEKPIALTIEDTDKMIDACKQNNVKLSVVHPNRFRPAMVKLKHLINNGFFGKLSHGNATVRWNRNQAYYDQAPWRGTKSLDGGVLMNQAIHNLDLLLWMMGDAEEVFSMAATRFRNIEAEDVSTGVVKFKDGSLGVVEAATTVYPKNLEETLSIFGESGTIKIGGTTASLIQHLNVEGYSEDDVKQLIGEIEQDPIGKPGHQCIIEDMIEAVQNDRAPVVTGEDGKKALELVISLYNSAELNKPVRLT